ncbi:MAG TPA: methyltransferase domain-containing protein [Solirubrobacteraceae bacterium]|nr:methyltransferase domain-containing protein [Solirubrobacteraceae bacterium]
MLSRRTLFTLGLSRVAERVEEQYAEQLDPTPVPPPVRRRVPARPAGVPPPAPAWPHRQGAELWEPVSAALPRPAGGRVLEVDELDYDLAWLPLQDGEFDGAVSAFAPMFASDGRAAIDELFRVVRAGGFVAFTVWTTPGVVGRLLALAEELDPPEAGVPAPMEWARDELLRPELQRHADDYELRQGDLPLTFASAEEAVQRLSAALRPLAWAPRQPELRELALEIVDGLAGGDPGPVALRATYVMAIAERRPQPVS